MINVKKFIGKKYISPEGEIHVNSVSSEFKNKYKHENYDVELKIIIPDEPIADSRPRPNSFTKAVAVINLQKLKKRFKLLYTQCELIQSIIIDSHYRIGAEFFLPVTVNEYSFIKKDKELLKMFENEQLRHMGIKDCDNMIKVHNDLVISQECLLLLDDAFNVGFLNIEKTVTTKDKMRTVLTILVSSKPKPWFRYKIEQNHYFFKAIISYKNMMTDKRTPKQQVKLIRSEFVSRTQNSKDRKDVLKYLKRVGSVLDQYPADLLKDMCDAGITKLNKQQAIFDLMMSISKGNKIAEEIIRSKKKVFWSDDVDTPYDN